MAKGGAAGSYVRDVFLDGKWQAGGISPERRRKDAAAVNSWSAV